MSRFWSTLTSSLTPYIPGEQPQRDRLVKLNTNESPYPPSPQVLEALAGVDGDSLRRYPDPESGDLRQAFAHYHGLRPEQIFLGNGSDEVLAHVFQALLKQTLPLLFPDVTYSFYPVWCQLYDIDYEQVPLAANYAVDVDLYGRDNGGIILPNPNAPTGMFLPLSGIRQLLEQSPDSVVVVDEAYIDFGGQSAVSLIDEYENLLVVHTLSKSRALAGLRVGLAMGNQSLIEGLQRVKNSFNSYPLDVVAQRATLASLSDDDWFRDCCARVIATRARLTRELEAMNFEVLPSAANFVMARHPGREAVSLFNALREQGIIVRHFNKPRLSEYLRISVGTDDECGRLSDALRELV
jgi:histidinol-phosphate aminotransferase